jgi:hypothetical protein
MAGFITMATVTPNYNWPVPTSTDFVKDGAASIEALGDAIDATVFGLGSSALTKINTTTFSAVASQAVSSVFSSTYDNYMVQIAITAITGGPYVQLRFRDAGGDVSGANYGYRVKNFSSLGAGSDVNVQGRTQTIAYLSPDGLGETFGATLEIFSPNLASKTQASNIGAVQVGNAHVGAFAYNTTDQFTGFSLIASTGTFTGTVTTYGVQK